MGATMYDYESICGEYAEIVHALCLVESNENASISGDNGKAWGPMQEHPAFFVEFGSTVLPGDTWIEAQLKVAAEYLRQQIEVHERPLDLVVQAYNLGVKAVFVNGERNPEYLQRYFDKLNKVRALKK